MTKNRMARQRHTAPAREDSRYRMSELVDVSGVSRDMIKYYLRAHLLPKPVKPRPNLSLYTENHLLLIQLILRIQQQTTLSLPEIASAFQAATMTRIQLRSNYCPTNTPLADVTSSSPLRRRQKTMSASASRRNLLKSFIAMDFWKRQSPSMPAR
jgi:DNA-binding transcriptional MerR regulator